MCGIVGYVGDKDAVGILLEGLKRLEYRGYDSAGLAVMVDGAMELRRSEGKLVNLEGLLREAPLRATSGIGHTRWATHGKPSEANAHPHRSDTITVVHNGIIENFLSIKEELEAEGFVFTSETDTEVIAHLVQREQRAGADFVEAVRKALGRIRGSYAVAVMDEDHPGTIIAAKNASPLIVGVADGEGFVASDIPAILSHTRDIVVLEEHQLAVVTKDGFQLSEIATGAPLEPEVRHITWSAAMAEKGGFKHFMKKEIFEQPRAVTDTIRGRYSLEHGEVLLEGLSDDEAFLEGIQRVVILACGTSWHAGLIGKTLIEKSTGLPVEVAYASEFRYADPIIDETVLCLAISQSGETADTLAAIQLARREGCRVVSICNVIGSSIPRVSDHVIYTHAGPEIGVASTKAFVTQIVALYLFALYAGKRRGRLSAAVVTEALGELVTIPGVMERVLEFDERMRAIATAYFRYQNMLYLGRGINFPVALEGALKLKEISYIHAEGYPAGEMKHGPIALIDEHMPVVMIVTSDDHYEKVFANLQEVRSRDARVIALVTEGNAEVEGFGDEIVYLPEVSAALSPLVTSIPMQLLAYHIADIRGTDVDQPRNLAKSVTVE